MNNNILLILSSTPDIFSILVFNGRLFASLFIKPLHDRILDFYNRFLLLYPIEISEKLLFPCSMPTRFYNISTLISNQLLSFQYPMTFLICLLTTLTSNFSRHISCATTPISRAFPISQRSDIFSASVLLSLIGVKYPFTPS